MTAGCRRRRLAMLALAGAAACCAPVLQAQETADAGAAVELAEPLKDPDFGVRTREPGLERIVEMYQWHRSGDGYALEWASQPVDSSGFAPGHENSPFPLQGRRWLPPPGTVRVDGHPLDASVLEQLGQWREFRPGFSALPGNLAATFQPEGDGLGSAENPLAPEPGDLRIHWRERVLPPLGERIELQGGTWTLRADAPAVEQGEPQGGGWNRALLAVVLGGVGVLLLAILLGRRKR